MIENAKMALSGKIHEMLVSTSIHVTYRIHNIIIIKSSMCDTCNFEGQFKQESPEITMPSLHEDRVVKVILLNQSKIKRDMRHRA